MLADRAQSHLVVIDVQERLVPAIAEAEAVVNNVARLIGYATVLGIPATFTEHMPERIGHLLPELITGTGPASSIIEKKTFSAAREPAFVDRIHRLEESDRSLAIICGMETHVCVMQTVLELRANGHRVLLVADAVGSRTNQDRDFAINRISEAGATIVSQEMMAFEWLERGDAPEFKDILKLLK